MSDNVWKEVEYIEENCKIVKDEDEFIYKMPELGVEQTLDSRSCTSWMYWAAIGDNNFDEYNFSSLDEDMLLVYLHILDTSNKIGLFSNTVVDIDIEDKSYKVHKSEEPDKEELALEKAEVRDEVNI